MTVTLTLPTPEPGMHFTFERVSADGSRLNVQTCTLHDDLNECLFVRDVYILDTPMKPRDWAVEITVNTVGS